MPNIWMTQSFALLVVTWCILVDNKEYVIHCYTIAGEKEEKPTVI